MSKTSTTFFFFHSHSSVCPQYSTSSQCTWERALILCVCSRHEFFILVIWWILVWTSYKFEMWKKNFNFYENLQFRCSASEVCAQMLVNSWTLSHDFLPETISVMELISRPTIKFKWFFTTKFGYFLMHLIALSAGLAFQVIFLYLNYNIVEWSMF